MTPLCSRCRPAAFIIDLYSSKVDEVTAREREHRVPAWCVRRLTRGTATGGLTPVADARRFRRLFRASRELGRELLLDERRRERSRAQAATRTAFTSLVDQVAVSSAASGDAVSARAGPRTHSRGRADVEAGHRPRRMSVCGDVLDSSVVVENALAKDLRRRQASSAVDDTDSSTAGLMLTTETHTFREPRHMMYLYESMYADRIGEAIERRAGSSSDKRSLRVMQRTHRSMQALVEGEAAVGTAALGRVEDTDSDGEEEGEAGLVEDEAQLRLGQRA